MEIFKLERTSRTPFVLMDSAKGLIEIKGISIPNNSYDFFMPLFERIDSYVAAPAGKTVVNLELEYLNTSTSKALLEMFKKLAVIANIEFNWHYDGDDEEMLEFGRNYESLLDCSFNFYELSSVK
jgi:hypothetical protein